MSYQINKNNIIYSIECWFMNVNFFFLLLLFFLFGFGSFIYSYHIFLSLRVLNPKLGDRPQLLDPKLGEWPQLLPHVSSWSILVDIFFQNSSNIKCQNIGSKYKEHYRMSEKFFALGRKKHYLEIVVCKISYMGNLKDVLPIYFFHITMC